MGWLPDLIHIFIYLHFHTNHLLFSEVEALLHKAEVGVTNGMLDNRMKWFIGIAPPIVIQIQDILVSRVEEDSKEVPKRT